MKRIYVLDNEEYEKLMDLSSYGMAGLLESFKNKSLPEEIKKAVASCSQIHTLLKHLDDE